MMKMAVMSFKPTCFVGINTEKQKKYEKVDKNARIIITKRSVRLTNLNISLLYYANN
jgi:hypothetical protein